MVNAMIAFYYCDMREEIEGLIKSIFDYEHQKSTRVC